MFPLNGGNSMMAYSCVRSIVVIPCTLGSKLSMRAGLEHMSVSHVLRAVAALSTSISKWDKAVEPFQMLIWWSGKESKKSWNSWEGLFYRKDSGQVEVSPLPMASSSAWPPLHLVHRWPKRACICGRDSGYLWLEVVHKTADWLKKLHLGLHESLMDCYLEVALKHLHQLLHIKGNISVSEIHQSSPQSLTLSTLSNQSNLTIEMADDW